MSKKNKKKEQEQKKKEAALKRKLIRYVVLVVFFSILFMILYNQPWFEEYSRTVLNAYAKVSNGILNLLGQNTTSSSGGAISSPIFSLEVRKGCDAIAPMILFIFSIAFFPANYKHKIKGIAIGIVLLAIVNIIRIVSLYFFGAYTSKYIFDLMHVDIWQIFFIVITLFIWILWIRSVYTEKTEKNAVT